MNLDISSVLMIVAILVEGPIVWWLTSRRRKEDNVDTLIKQAQAEARASARKLYQRIDEIEESHASKEYVDSKIEHVKEVVEIQFNAILENLDYIRRRVDEQQHGKK